MFKDSKLKVIQEIPNLTDNRRKILIFLVKESNEDGIVCIPNNVIAKKNNVSEGGSRDVIRWLIKNNYLCKDRCIPKKGLTVNGSTLTYKIML